MAHVARRQQTSARNGFDHLANDHAIEIDEVAGLEIRERHLMFGGNVLRDRAGLEAKPHLHAGLQRDKRYHNVVACIESEDSFRHSELPRSEMSRGEWAAAQNKDTTWYRRSEERRVGKEGRSTGA